MFDPYVYPGTETLTNKFEIKDAAKLQDLEAALFRLQISEPLPLGDFNYDHLKAIHRHLFGELYHWAGEERSVDIIKGNDHFARKEFITPELRKLFLKLKSDNYLKNLDHSEFCKKLSYYFNEVNAAHPFREGNGRTLRVFCDELSEKAGYYLDWTKVKTEEYIQANIKGFAGDYDALEFVFKKIYSSLSLSHSIGVAQQSIDQNSIEQLKIYVEKQVHLSELVTQKNKNLGQDPTLAKNFSQEAMEISNELKNIAKQLITNLDIQKLLKHPQVTSLQKQGGFPAIYERLKNNKIEMLDLVTVARHANSNIKTLSLSQGREQGKGGRSY